MTQTTPATVTSLADLESLVIGLAGSDWKPHAPYLFRGHSDSTWGLTPAVERPQFLQVAQSPAHRVSAEPSPALLGRHLEAMLLEHIEMTAAHWFPPGATAVERYILAQHHGMPTRLLDWTESPLVALYFATAGDEDRDGAVHAMMPRNLWMGTYWWRTQDLTQESSIVAGLVDWARSPGATVDNKALTLYPFVPDPPTNATAYESKQYEDEGTQPHGWIAVPFFPRSSIERVRLQRGAFTFHQSGSLADLLTCDQHAEMRIARWIVPGRAKRQLRMRLHRCGIHKGSLFSTLDAEIEALIVSKGLQRR